MENNAMHNIRPTRLFWLMLVLNVLYITWMKFQLAPLQTNEILSFEISRTTERASTWVNNWKAQPPKFDRAVSSLSYDYVFIILYCVGLIVAVLQFGKWSGQDLLARSSRFIAGLLILAGICDVLENLFLSRVLQDPALEFPVRMAYNFAAAKFSILILAMLFLAVCAIFHFLKRFERKLVMGN